MSKARLKAKVAAQRAADEAAKEMLETLYEIIDAKEMLPVDDAKPNEITFSDGEFFYTLTLKAKPM